MQPVFQYINFRTFLKDYYEEKKASEGYTYRDFSKSAGMNSSSWLLHLIKGTKNLSNGSIIKVTKTLRLTGSEAEYFEVLVHFTQAKDNDTRDYFYRRMLACKKNLNSAQLSEDQYDYYNKWYHPVIRSLVSKVKFGENYKLLGSWLIPQVSPAEAKASVALLARLGLIKKDDSGNWVQAEPIITTGDEVLSLNVVNYHKQVSRLAEDAFDRSEREERDISALTLGISAEAFNQIKARIQSFRKEIMEIVRESDNPDRVFQMNLQFFPVSKRGEHTDEV